MSEGGILKEKGSNRLEEGTSGRRVEKGNKDV